LFTSPDRQAVDYLFFTSERQLALRPKPAMRRPQANTPAQAEISPRRPRRRATSRHSNNRPRRLSQPPRAKRRAHRASRERNREEGSDAFTPSEITRGGDDVDDRDGEHHKRGKGDEKHRAREDEDADAEKQMRKALNHVKGKVPRLVDVLTNP
jgi:hypothetical protein